MASKLTQKTLERSRTHKRLRRWNKVVTGLAAVVVFCTTYALILPAITMEKEPTCGLETHEHTAACYELPKELTCFYQRSAKNGEEMCVVHTHSELCFDTGGELICALPEVRLHTHGTECYTLITPEPLHTHSDSCWQETKVLSCGLEETEGHAHTAECEKQEQTLVCEIPETHVHADECRDGDGNLICGLDDTAGHAHGPACQESQTGYACGLEESEPHKHTDECYTVEKKFICGREEATEEQLANPPQPCEELTCGKTEVILHTHAQDCFDGENNLICPKREVFDHVHLSSCLATTTNENAEKVLACGIEEHTHDDIRCYVDLEADLETPELWEATLPELAGETWAEDLLAVAVSQLDYEESTVNVQVTPDGEIFGCTRYGQWAGELYGPWSEHFVNFCLYYANIPADAFPVHEGRLHWCEQLVEDNFGIYFTPDAYTPVPGDTVYIDRNLDGIYDHMAIAEQLLPPTEEEEARITVIQGGIDGRVQRTDYQPDAPEILGYASIEAARERWELLNPASPVYCGREIHTHTAECRDEAGNVICLLEEHVHAESCFQAPPVYYCGDPDHEHNDTCLPPPPAWICGREAHLHEDACYNNEGTLICSIEEHDHSEDCLEKTYYCGMVAHTHEPGCKNQAEELICTVPEHIHSEACLVEKIVYKQVNDLESLTPGTAYAIVYDDGQGPRLMGGGEGMMNVTLIKTTDKDGTPGVNLVLDGTDGSELLPEACLWQPASVPATLELDEEAEPQQPVAVLMNNLTAPEAELMVQSHEQGLTAMDPNASSVMALSLDLDTQFQQIAANEFPIELYADTGKEEPSDSTDGNTNKWTNDLPCPGGAENCNLNDYLKPESWVACTGTNPFGTAQEFNLFLLGNMHNWGVVHGNAAIMGTIDGTTNSIGYDTGSSFNYAADVTGHYRVGLILGGEQNCTTGVDQETTSPKELTVKNGTAIAQESEMPMIGMEIGLDDDHRHIATVDELNAFFDNAKGSIQEEDKNSLIYRNQATYNYANELSPDDPHYGTVRWLTDYDVKERNQDIEGDTYEDRGGVNGVTALTGCDIVLEGDDPFYNVFNVPASYFNAKTTGSSTDRIMYLDVPFGSYTLINVVGEGVEEIEQFNVQLRYRDSNGKFIQQPAKHTMADYTQTQRTMVNFDPGIKTVTTSQKGEYLYASILGPNVKLNVPGDTSINLHGTIVLGELYCEKRGNESAIIDNGFIAGSKLTMKKDVVCDDQKDGCPIAGEDGKDPCWAGYFADVTLQSTNDSSGTTDGSSSSTITAEVLGLALDNTAKVVDGLTPGKYQVSVEKVYRMVNGVRLEIRDGTGEYFKYTDSGMAAPTEEELPKDAEDNPMTHDPIFQNHLFNRATFGTWTGAELHDGDKLTLEVTSNMIDNLLITNHYGTEITQQYSVQKVWKEHGYYIDHNGTQHELDYEIPPPANAYVKVQLWRYHLGEKPQKVPDSESGITGKSEVRLDPDNEWFHSWLGLPDYELKDSVDEDGKPVTYKSPWIYDATESMKWPGFTHNDTEDISYDGGVQTFINWKQKITKGALTVEKQWYNEFDAQLTEDQLGAAFQATVQLYRQQGDAADKNDPAIQNRLRTVNLYMEDTPRDVPLDSGKYFPGSDVDATVTFYIKGPQLIGGATDVGKVGELKLKCNGQEVATAAEIEAERFYVQNAEEMNYYFKMTATAHLNNANNNIELQLLQSDSEDAYKIITTDVTVTDLLGKVHEVTPPSLSVAESRISDDFIHWKTDQPLYPMTDADLRKSDGTAERAKVLLHQTTPEKWTYTWHDLPAYDAGNPRTRYRYYVLEEPIEGYQPTYIYSETGLSHGKEIGSVPGVNSGFITIQNRPVPPGGPELPDCGGMGTTPYTLGGLLTTAFAVILMQVNLKKRRKEGNAS